MHCESPVSRPQSFSKSLNTLSTVWKHQTVFYTYIQMYGVLWSIVVCSDEPLVPSTFLQKSSMPDLLSARSMACTSMTVRALRRHADSLSMDPKTHR